MLKVPGMWKLWIPKLAQRIFVILQTLLAFWPEKAQELSKLRSVLRSYSALSLVLNWG